MTKNKTLNFILIILYLNFIFQFIGLFFSENNINNSYYLFLAILSIIAVANLYNNGLHNINYLILLCVLTPVVIAYGYLSYEWFLTTRNLNMYGTFPDVFLPLVDFSSNVIRSSGLSRSSTILLIPLFYLILIDKIKFFYLIPYSRLVYLIPYLILSGIIFYCQSRIVILFFISFTIFSIFYFLWNKTKKYKFKKAFILIILPTIFVISLVAIKEDQVRIMEIHQSAIDTLNSGGSFITGQKGIRGKQNRYNRYVSTMNAYKTQDGLDRIADTGILHEQTHQVFQPNTMWLTLHSGLTHQRADDTLNTIANHPTSSSRFKRQTDYYDGPDYWTPWHTLSDTAYVVVRCIIAEGDEGVPETKYAVRGKLIDCYNYDFSYKHHKVRNYKNEAGSVSAVTLIKPKPGAKGGMGYAPVQATVTFEDAPEGGTTATGFCVMKTAYAGRGQGVQEVVLTTGATTFDAKVTTADTSKDITVETYASGSATAHGISSADVTAGTYFSRDVARAGRFFAA